jgi:hypothetical protein
MKTHQPAERLWLVMWASVLLVCWQSSVSNASTIGPDAFGYTASYEVPFAFEDISSTGTRVLANEDLGTTNANLGFSFNFYGVNYNSAFFSLKGVITFGGGNSNFNNVNLTNSVSPNLPTIAGLWSDWITTNASADAVYYQTLGSSGNRRFIVQWNNIQGWPTSPGGITFEAILYEASGDILFQYLDVLSGDSRDNGAKSTVGIRDTSGQTNGRNLGWSFNQPIIQNGQAILFSARPRILSQPQDQTTGCGSNATFAVVVTGASPLKYQWQFNGQPLSSATSSSLTLSNVSCVNAGNYSVVITNTAGIATSSNALLVVNSSATLSIICPGKLTVTNPANVPSPNTNLVTVSNGCGHVVVSFVGDSLSSNGCTNIISRTYQAIDDCGASAYCTQSIFVLNRPQILGFSTSQNVQPDGVQIVYCANVSSGSDVIYNWSIGDGNPISYFQSGNCFYVTYSATDTNLNSVFLNALNSCGGTGDTPSPPTTTCGICLSRGLPSLLSGTSGSGTLNIVPANNCGVSDSTGKWFKMIVTNDTGLVTISTENSLSSDTGLAVFTGPLISPDTLTNVACSGDISTSNKQSRVTFNATKGLVYWIVVDPGINAAGLKLSTGFEPRLINYGFKPDGSFELNSTVAPAIPYRIQAATNLAANPVDWSTVLATNLIGGYQYLYFRDTNTANTQQRFYRIAPRNF